MRELATTILLMLTAGVGAAEPLPVGALLRLGETDFRAGGEIRHLRFSPDGKTLLGWAVGIDRQLHPIAWNVATGSLVTFGEHHSPPDEPARSTPAVRLSDNRIVTAGPGCGGRVWDATTRRQLAFLAGHAAPVTAIALSDDGKCLATGSADGLIKLWNASTLHPQNSLRGHTGYIHSIRMTSDSQRAVTLGADHSARVWDLRTGKEIRAFATDGPVQLTSGGQFLLLPSGNRTLVRDLVTGLEVVPDQPPERPTTSLREFVGRLGLAVACSPDGRVVAMARSDGRIGLYETATGQLRRILAGHGVACHTLAFTPDGTRLLTAGADQTVLIWGVRLQDLLLTEAIKRETRAGKLWTMLSAEPAEAAYLAMARFAAEPAAAVKMARLRLMETSAGSELAHRRAIELLESLGTPEAREMLEELASGDSSSGSALAAQEARRALERLSANK